MNAWVLLWGGFRWKPDILGGVGTCLGLILDDVCLKMTNNCFYLCPYVCRLRPAYATWIHSYAALFLRFCICGNRHAYARSCLRTWALTRVREAPGKGPTLPIFTYFSTISVLYAILIPLFVIFVSKHHYILLFIFILASKTSFFINFAWIKNLISPSFFSFFFFTVSIPLCW